MSFVDFNLDLFFDSFELLLWFISIFKNISKTFGLSFVEFSQFFAFIINICRFKSLIMLFNNKIIISQLCLFLTRVLWVVDYELTSIQNVVWLILYEPWHGYHVYYWCMVHMIWFISYESYLTYDMSSSSYELGRTCGPLFLSKFFSFFGGQSFCWNVLFMFLALKLIEIPRKLDGS